MMPSRYPKRLRDAQKRHRLKYARLRLCVDCGRKSPDSRTCARCKEKVARKYKILKDNQICIDCKRKPARRNKVHCQLCSFKNAISNRLKGKQRVFAKIAVEKFNGKCQCCGFDTKTVWCIEHEHGSGKFRGIVCASCNMVLGHSKENIKRLISVIKYLRKNVKH